MRKPSGHSHFEVSKSLDFFQTRKNPETYLIYQSNIMVSAINRLSTELLVSKSLDFFQNRKNPETYLIYQWNLVWEKYFQEALKDDGCKYFQDFFLSCKNPGRERFWSFVRTIFSGSAPTNSTCLFMQVYKQIMVAKLSPYLLCCIEPAHTSLTLSGVDL